MLGSGLRRKGRQLAARVSREPARATDDGPADDPAAEPTATDATVINLSERRTAAGGITAATTDPSGPDADEEADADEDADADADEEADREETADPEDSPEASHPADQPAAVGQAAVARLRALGSGTSLPSAVSVRHALMIGARIAVLSRRATHIPQPAAPLVALLWAAGVGSLLALLLTMVSGVQGSSLPVAKEVWLTAHHILLDTPAGQITLLPLGLLLITVLPLRRAGRFIRAHVDTIERARLLGLTAAGGYAVVVMIVASTTEPPVSSPILSAGGWAFVVAVASGAWGFAKDRGQPTGVPVALAGAAWAVSVPLIVGALLVVGLVALNFGAISDAQQQLAAPGFEQVGVTLLQVMYLPNLVIWAGAYVIGTGFCVGLDQVVSPFSAADPAMPALPLFAALPTESPRWSGLLPVCVALGGAAAAMLLDRRIPQRRLAARIGRVAALAATTGIGWFLLSALSGGSLGSGRLDYLGPAGGTALAAAALTGAGGLLWALLPTMAADAKPMAADLRTRVTKKTAEARSGAAPVKSGT